MSNDYISEFSKEQVEFLLEHNRKEQKEREYLLNYGNGNKLVVMTGLSSHAAALAHCAAMALTEIDRNPHNEFIQQKRQGKRRIY
jgi:hypothetical protein